MPEKLRRGAVSCPRTCSVGLMGTPSCRSLLKAHSRKPAITRPAFLRNLSCPSLRTQPGLGALSSKLHKFTFKHASRWFTLCHASSILRDCIYFRWVSDATAAGHKGGACWLLDGNVTEAGCHVQRTLKVLEFLHRRPGLGFDNLQLQLSASHSRSNARC